MTVDSRSTPSPSQRKISGRRAAYSIAAGTASVVAAGVSTQANAAITYSGLQNISINPGFSLDLNVDGDAFNDVLLKNFVFGGGPYQGATVDFAPGKIVGFTSGNAYVSALSAGAVIDAATANPTFFGSMAYGAVNPNAQFNNAVNKYIGLSFPSGANLYYGWIRVDVTNSTSTFVVKDWAYESTSGVGILAGAVPEPGALGLLAAGASGLAALRRKRLATEKA